MKKVIFITALLLATAMTVSAQTIYNLNVSRPVLSNQADPQQLHMIRMHEYHLYHGHSMWHNNSSMSDEQQFSELHEQEKLNKEPNIYTVLSDFDNYNQALKVATKAEKEKEKAERVYVNLTTKQFEKKNAKQMDKAQKNLEKATRNYYTALNDLKRTREELEKYR